MDRAGAYVGLTRGRESNTAWAVTESLNPDQPSLTARGTPRPRPRPPATTRTPTPTPATTSPPSTSPHAADAHRTNAGTLLALIEEETRVACRERLDRDLDTLTADGLLTDEDRARLGADQGTEHLSRLLRAHEQAGHDPLAVLRDAVTSGRSLTDAVSVAQVLATRIHRATGSDLPTPQPSTTPTERTAARPRRTCEARADASSRRQRGSRPAWAGLPRADRRPARRLHRASCAELLDERRPTNSAGPSPTCPPTSDRPG